MSAVTLGELAPPNAARDAVHVAVAPVIAGCLLEAGAHVTIKNGTAWPATGPSIVGIIDPFLKNGARKGQMVWVMMKPNSVADLRHEWTHPAFPETPTPPWSDEGAWDEDYGGCRGC